MVKFYQLSRAICTISRDYYARNIDYMYEKEITKSIMLHVLKSHPRKKVIPSVYSDLVTKQNFNASSCIHRKNASLMKTKDSECSCYKY